MKQILLPLSLLCLFFSACKKDKLDLAPDRTPDPDYLVFGSYYGFCHDEDCVKMFKVTDSVVWEDISDRYWKSFFTEPGNFATLSQDKFEFVKDLSNQIPADLFTDAGVIGHPDAGDWGGLYLELQKSGVNRKWKIDMLKDNVPEKYHPFIDLLKEKIAQMHQ